MKQEPPQSYSVLARHVEYLYDQTGQVLQVIQGDAAETSPQELLTGTREDHQFHLRTNAAGAAKTARRPQTKQSNQPTTVLPSFSLSVTPFFPLVQCYSEPNQQQHMFPTPRDTSCQTTGIVIHHVLQKKVAAKRA